MPGAGELPVEQSVSARISGLIVQLLHTHTGRGPTSAWTSINADLVSVVLRETLSRGELSLVADGQTELVLSLRQAYQRRMASEMIAGVEKLTGRTVLAFLSANHLDPDIAIESFVLEPASFPPLASG
jgi:uncharacterized protein YbcI